MRRSREVAVLIKTVAHQRSAVRSFLQRHHPYEVPLIVEVLKVAANPRYRRWLSETLAGR